MRRLAQAVFVLATAVAVVGMHSLGAGHTPVGHSSGHSSAHSSGHSPALRTHLHGLPVEAMAGLAVTTQMAAPNGEGDHGMAQMCLAVLTLVLAGAVLARVAQRSTWRFWLASSAPALAMSGRSPPYNLTPSLHRLCVSRT